MITGLLGVKSRQVFTSRNDVVIIDPQIYAF